MISTGPVQGKPLGGISSVVQSVKNLDSSFLHVDKQTLVELRPEAVGTCRSAGLLHRAPTTSKKKFQFPVLYRCSYDSCPSLSIKKGTPCEFHCLSCFREEVAILPNDLPKIEATIVHRACRCAGLLHRAPTTSKKKFQFPKLYRCSRYGCPSLPIKKGRPCQFHYGYNFREEIAIRPDDLQELEATIVSAEDPVEEASRSTGQGFVRENITYLVTDSLEIMPSTTIRSIKVLNKLKVGALADMESSDITVSMTQVLELLQSALTSSSYLNDVFGKKQSASQTSFTKIQRKR